MTKTDPELCQRKPAPTKPISDIVNQVVRAYVLARASARSGIDLDKPEFKSDDRTDWAKIPEAFDKERTEVVKSLFLEFRSRRDQAFVNHFSQTLFAVKQWLSDDDRQQLADWMLDENRRDDLKALTLVSLSANS